MARFLTAVQEKYMPLYANGVCASYCCLKIESDYAGYSLTIPSKCSALMNKQLFPTESIDSFIDDIQRIYAEKVCVGNLTICREIPSYPAYQLSPEQSDVQRLTSLLRKQFGHTPELRINQSVSDGNILYNELSIPTVLFGPHGVAFHTECEYVKSAVSLNIWTSYMLLSSRNTPDKDCGYGNTGSNQSALLLPKVRQIEATRSCKN